jgi:metal-sulfur cluster biosynthetic enzyme
MDPEVGLSVVELGLVYAVHVDDVGGVDVEMSVTSPACPLGEHMALDAEHRIGLLPDVKVVTVRVVLEPPWSAERMTAAARATLGW